MGFRITTNMTMNTYRHNLMNVNTTLSGSRDKVLTHRNFNSFYEDPSGATQAFRLRQAYYEASSQLANNDDTYKRFHSGWLSLGKAVDDLTDKTSRFSTLLAENGTEGSGRAALGQVIGETAKSVVQMMNCQYGDQFIFSGSDGLRVPFSWSPEGDLLYRGVNVNAGGVKAPTAAEPNWLQKAKDDAVAAGTWNDGAEEWFQYMTHATDVEPSNGLAMPTDWITSQTGGAPPTDPIAKGWYDYYTHATDEKPTAPEPTAIPGDDSTFEAKKNEYGLYEGVPAKGSAEYEKLTDTNKAWADYYNDQNDYTKLKMMAEEEVNLDVGMGMQEIDGKIVDGSVFNTALPGIKMLGFGVDKDGDPLNIVVLQQRLGEIFKKCGEDGSFHPPEDEAVSLRLMDKLKAAQAKTTSEYVELDTKAKYLQTNSERLSEQKNTLNEQVLDIEQVDLADAISTFSWDLYCWNAALKIGNQLLSQSLIDYMN